MRETRTATGAVQARSGTSTSAGVGTLVGYAAIFGSPTVIAGVFREQIKRGAFTQAIGRDDVRALYNHTASLVLGRTKAGTLKLSEDAKGLRYEVSLPDTSYARDLLVSVKRGDVSQSSFAFEVVEDEWDFSGARDAKPLRTILQARLADISPVTFPAYADTTVTARSAEGEPRTMETSIDRNTQSATSLTRMVLDIERHRDAMAKEHIPCDTCGTARATMLRRSGGRDRRVCAECSFTGRTQTKPATATRTTPATAAERDLADMRARLARAERGETITTNRPRAASRYTPAPKENIRVPKTVPTRY